MINTNGILCEENAASLALNRGYLFGDGVFETVKILDGKILFLEDHYFRLMSAMRIVRMQIPMSFTMEYLEEQFLATAQAVGCIASARARITVSRNFGGNYTPITNEVSFVITVSRLETFSYKLESDAYEVDLYKDFYISSQLLSSIKTTNKIIHVTGSIYAIENGLQNCLLLNDHKNVAEALNGNLFMVTGYRIVTPPVSEGCLNGVMRKQILMLLRSDSRYEVVEEAISPFDLQKADELFITNVIMGIQPITRYRKKDYKQSLAADLLNKLNAKIRLA